MLLVDVQIKALLSVNTQLCAYWLGNDTSVQLQTVTDVKSFVSNLSWFIKQYYIQYIHTFLYSSRVTSDRNSTKTLQFGVKTGKLCCGNHPWKRGVLFLCHTTQKQEPHVVEVIIFRVIKVLIDVCFSLWRSCDVVRWAPRQAELRMNIIIGQWTEQEMITTMTRLRLLMTQ